MTKKHVVIIGGGFAGMACMRKLAGKQDVHVTMLDKNNYHQFKPLLYQVATSALTPDDVATPFRRFFETFSNIDIKMEEVASLNPKALTATTKDGRVYRGDILILSAGSTVNFFNVKGASKNAFPLYTLKDAEILRSKILAAFELCDNDPKLMEQGVLNFVIVGAGPTGTEIAGALADLLYTTLPIEFPDLPVHNARIYLIDHGLVPLKAFKDESQSYAMKVLEKRNVILKMGFSVVEVTQDRVLLSDGSPILSRTVIWAGGLEATPILGLEKGKDGRIQVLPDLTVKGFPSIFALGDAANIPNGADFLPQLASVALQSGESAAKNILADCRGNPRVPFKYRDKGIMAMIGKNAAIAEIGKKRHVLKGPIAFAAWLMVHAALLPSFRQRAEAFFEWGWNYFGRAQPFQVLDKEDALKIHNEDRKLETK